MLKKKLIPLLLLIQIIFGTVGYAQKVKVTKAKAPEVTVSVKAPDKPKIPVDTSKFRTKSFFKEFLDLLKKQKLKKNKPPKIKAEIAAIKAKEKMLEDMIKMLSPKIDAPGNSTLTPIPQKLIEWSLHAIEESKYLSLYDSKNYYRTEKQWGDFSGVPNEAGTDVLQRNHGDKTVYGFHPFWLGLYYYNYNFELYDRVAYFAYSVAPETGKSATLFPAHSFKTSQIVRKANEQSKGLCKIDLCVSSYGINKNTLLFSGDWEAKINTLINEVTGLVVESDAGGICLDFQQVATADSAKFIKMVSLFHNRFESIAPGKYQISMVLPSYSQYFPYTVSGKNFLDLWQNVDRFIVMGYSSFSALYNPAKDSLATGITHDVLWNILLVDDGINHYASLTQDVSDGPVSPERIISDKLLLSIPACDIKLLGSDSLKALKYSDLKLLKLDDGFLPSFQEKLAYITKKNLKGVALWSLGYDNGAGDKDLQKLLAAYTYGAGKQDESMLNTMEKLIAENKTLTLSMDEFFPPGDSTLSDTPVPLPDVLKVDLPSPEGTTYKTEWEKEKVIIQHVVVLCLIILLFFALLGIIIALFFESTRESFLTKENGLFLVVLFSLLGLILLLKKLDVINNTILLFAVGILIGSVIPFLIRKKQKNNQREDRP